MKEFLDKLIFSMLAFSFVMIESPWLVVLLCVIFATVIVSISIEDKGA